MSIANTLLFVSIITIIDSINGEPTLTKCVQSRSLQNMTIDCQKEFYKLLKDNTTVDCDNAVITNLKPCLSLKIRACMKEEKGDDLNVIEAAQADGYARSMTFSPEMYCATIQPFVFRSLSNCSSDYQISQGMCANIFTQRFKENRASTGLCSAYSSQMTCLEEAMKKYCFDEEIRNVTTTYHYLFEKEGNPFCFGDETPDNPDASNTLVGQSLLIAFSVIFIKFIL